jgi:hypothetical protein
MSRDWGRTQRVAIVVAAAVVGAGLWLTGTRDLNNLILVFLAIGGAAAVAWLAPCRPVAAFGILFLLASLSALDLSTRIGNMRLEQPAIVAGYAALFLGPVRPSLSRIRRLWPIGAAFGVYLVCLTLSSILFAVDRMDSLRMTFWTGLSMLGGLLALLLLARGATRATEWILGSGYLQAIVGFGAAVVFFGLGPVWLAGSVQAPGVTLPVSSIPKVTSLSWEANLFASFLAALTVLGLDRFWSGGRSIGKALFLVMAAAIGLGVTRGAFVGLGAGMAAYLLFVVTPPRAWARDAIRRVGLRGAIFAAALVVGVLVASVLLQGGRPASSPLDFTKLGFGRWAVASAPGQPGGAKPTPAPAVVVPPPDTVTFRLDRIPVALADVPHSLLIGLGANSFGQRHTDPSQRGAPDHIAVLALAALYESGIIGAAGLGIGFLLVLLTYFMAGRRSPNRGLIAAYAGAVVCLLAAYEATNALNFALIWLIAGAGLAVAIEPAAGADSTAGAEPAAAAQPADSAAV